MRYALVALALVACTPTLPTGTWVALAHAPKVKGKQDDLFFLDERRGWSVNGQGRIFHTVDGGAHWEKQLEQRGTYFRAILMLDDKRGFAGTIGVGYFPGVTDTRPLFRTRDGGVTWSEVTEITGPRPVGICNFSRVDDTHLVATGRVGGPSFFLSSSDAGETWTSIDVSASIAMLVDAHFATPDVGVIVGASSKEEDASTLILRTTDGGKSWSEAYRSPAGKGEMGWKLSFPSETIGYAAILGFGGAPAAVVKTVDGGATWTRLPVASEPFEGLGIGFVTPDVGWVGGGPATRPGYKTVDGGKTWTVDPTLGARTNRFRFVGTRGYSIGSDIRVTRIDACTTDERAAYRAACVDESTLVVRCQQFTAAHEACARSLRP